MDYLEFKFVVQPCQPASEILIAELGMLGFESFVEHQDGVSAYIPKEEYEEDILVGVHILQSEEFDISYSITEVARVNWNTEWEKSFKPIVVDNICSVRAPFHPESNTEYEIIIEPKMSFGTGHHATTHLMIQFLLKHDFNGKNVLDMGCGTGILAILAEKRGAASVDAIDIDNWCYQNTLENVERNNCTRISVYEGSAKLLSDKKYHFIIANINRNILLDDIEIYCNCLEPAGHLFLSGFYEKDISEIRSECEKHGLKYKDYLEREAWVALQFINPKTE